MPVDEGVELCAPLLAEAWTQIQERVRRGELGRARHVLLLNTALKEEVGDLEPESC